MQVSESITRRSASNLALAFCLLPKEKRRGMTTLYAFCREVDDIADEDARTVADRKHDLDFWRDEVRTACRGGRATLPVVRELQPIIQAYRLPFELFDELLQGVEMDLEITRYENYADLESYCYRVASVVGLLSIEIFGYTDPRCREYAVQLGQALQLTNILRDVRNDAARDRIYLPLEELERYHVLPEEVLSGQYSGRYAALAGSVADRARQFFRAARESLPPVDRRAMVTAELMGAVYWRLLKKIERRKYDVFGATTTRLGKMQKALLIAGTWTRCWTGYFTSGYGAR